MGRPKAVSGRLLVALLAAATLAARAQERPASDRIAFVKMWELSGWERPYGDIVVPLLDGRRLVINDLDTLRLVDIEDANASTVWKIAAGPLLPAPGGDALWLGTAKGLRRLDLKTGKETSPWRAQAIDVSFLRVARDGKRALTADYVSQNAATARVWDLSTGKSRVLADESLHEGRPVTSDFVLYAAALSRDGRRAVTGGRDAKLRIWDAGTGRLITVSKFPASIMCLDFSPDDRSLVVGDAKGQIALVDLASGKTSARWKGHDSPTSAVAYSPDGAHILSGGGDKLLKLWDAATHKELESWGGHDGTMPRSVAFLPGGRLAVTSGGGEVKTITRVKVWDIAAILAGTRGAPKLIPAAARPEPGPAQTESADDAKPVQLLR